MLDSLFQKLAEKVKSWRSRNYAHPDYPAISEILKFATLEDGSLRFLRSAQLMALETYWYLRLVENTPHVMELYNKYYQDDIEFLDKTHFSLYNIEYERRIGVRNGIYLGW